ncbi:hypothetical protein ACWCW7_34455 [Nocardia tengchongensis]
MAREYARLRVSASDDPDVEELSIEAQWLYFKVLLPHPLLSSCGVVDWRPKHLVRKGKNATVVKILAAAAELERARFLMFDLETEQVLLRSYVRRDELLKNPKMAGAVIKAYHAVASRELQAALVTEFKRIREEFPEYSSWSYKDTDADLARILSRPDLASVGYQSAFTDGVDYGNAHVNAVEITNPDAMQIGNPEAVENGYGEPVSDGDQVPGADNPADSVPIPSTCTYTSKPAPLGGPVTGVRHQGADLEANDPPPRSCPEHPNGTTEPCAACGIFRRAREAHDSEAKRLAAEQRAAERDAESEVRRLAIVNCSMCDSDGQIIRDGDEPLLCDHDPGWEERTAGGRAEFQKALAEMRGKRSPAPAPEELARIRTQLSAVPDYPDADQPSPDPISPASVEPGPQDPTSQDHSKESAHGAA